MVSSGLDVAAREMLDRFQGETLGLVCNQATLASDLRHLLDVFLPGHHAEKFRIGAAFGPQHGIWGHTQDNMIEWEGYTDPSTGLLFHSLYGEHRKPTPTMLQGLDRLVIDVPDIGTRYYTFIWTTFLCMEAAMELGIPVTILDRPNPLGGTQIEGTMLDPELSSFVGWKPIPTRHGLTLGEAALYFRNRFLPHATVEVIPCLGWDGAQYGDQTGLPWALPSPNMPTVDTAVVYPGQCLLEATTLSEGRGTTRPFEMFGAPYIDGRAFCDELNALSLPGVHYRPIHFEPTFHKYAKQVCQGAFIHVTDRRSFEPLLSTIAILQTIIRRYGDQFAFTPPPYEYVYDRDPIDILAGQWWLRRAIENDEPLDDIRERFRAETADFHRRADVELIYPRPSSS
jgi:uncharacterized protein YbbC (DUF1343 family)